MLVGNKDRNGGVNNADCEIHYNVSPEKEDNDQNTTDLRIYIMRSLKIIFGFLFLICETLM